MSEKELKLKPGEEIEIFIRRLKKREKIGNAPVKRGGIIDPFSRDEFLPRRLKTSTGIIFYDLGQLAGDAYIDNPYTITPDVVYNSFGSNLNVGAVPVLSDYRAREAVFIDNLETLEDDYRKLQTNDADPLGIGILGAGVSVNSSNPNWKNSGLVLSDEELSNANFGIGSPVYNYSFRLRGDFVYPITSEPDFDAARVEFTPGKNDIYFLLPEIRFVYALNSQGSNPEHLQYLNYFYRALPRTPAVDPSNPFYGTVLAGSKQWFSGNSESAYNNARNSALVARALPNARLFEAVGSADSYAWTPGNSPADFDNPAYSSLYPVYPSGNFAHSNFIQLGAPEKILLAIIKQGENYFFVWNFAD